MSVTVTRQKVTATRTVSGVEVDVAAGQGLAGPPGATGPNSISNSTALGTLTDASANAPFLLSADATGLLARKVPLSAVGRSLLGAATAQAGRSLLGIADVSTGATGNVYLGGLVDQGQALVLNLWNSSQGGYDELTLDDAGWYFPRTISAPAFAGDGSALTNIPAPANVAHTNAVNTFVAGQTISASGSVDGLTIQGQSGAFPLKVKNGSTITATISYDGQVYAAGTYSSDTGFRTTAFGAYVGVASYCRAVFTSTGTDLYGGATGNNPLRINGESGQTAPLLQLTGYSSTTAGRPQAEIDTAWATSTDATRAGRLLLRAYSTTTAQEGLRVEGNSGGVRLGFFGGSAAAKPTVTGSRAANAALASLLTALAGLGLLTDSSS